MRSTLQLLAVVSMVVSPLISQSPEDFFVRNRIVDASASPDGGLIAYTQRRADLEADRFIDEVFVIPSRGGDPWLLGPGSKPAFAPVGEAIAWIGPDGELMQRDSLGGEDNRLVPGGHWGARSFRWAPDGVRIAYLGLAERYSDGERWFSTNRFRLKLVGRYLTGDGFEIGPSNPGLAGLEEFDWIDDSTIVVSGRELDSGAHPEASSLYLVDASPVGVGGVGALKPRQYLVGEGGRWHTPVVSPNGEWIAFTGQAVGPGLWSAAELIVVRPDGTGLKRLTIGLDRDVMDIHWESNSRHIWFATESRGTRNIQRVDSRNGKIDRPTTGTHILSLEDIPRRGGWAVAVQRSPRTAGSLIRFPLNRTSELRALITPDAEVATGEIEEFEFRASDGTVIAAWLHRPPGFDPALEWPLLVDIHGGPHAMAGAGYSPSALAHAAAGRLVLQVNHRGSTGFGFDIVNGIEGASQGRDFLDLKEAIAAVVGRGYVDPERVGVAGHGAGGVLAERLRQEEGLIENAILRCTGGSWLVSTGVPDRAVWTEWFAARPSRRPVPIWLSDNAVSSAGRDTTPLLVIEGSPTEAMPMAFGETVHLELIRAGILSRFERVATNCASNGPKSQYRLFDLESQWLNRAR